MRVLGTALVLWLVACFAGSMRLVKRRNQDAPKKDVDEVALEVAHAAEEADAEEAEDLEGDEAEDAEGDGDAADLDEIMTNSSSNRRRCCSHRRRRYAQCTGRRRRRRRYCACESKEAGEVGSYLAIHWEVVRVSRVIGSKYWHQECIGEQRNRTVSATIKAGVSGVMPKIATKFSASGKVKVTSSYSWEKKVCQGHNFTMTPSEHGATCIFRPVWTAYNGCMHEQMSWAGPFQDDYLENCPDPNARFKSLVTQDMVDR